MKVLESLRRGRFRSQKRFPVQRVRSIKLDTLSFLSGVEVDGTHAAYDWTSASGLHSGNLFSALEADGKLNYKVTITSSEV